MKMTMTILAASLLLVSMPIAAADAESETDPACEAGQDWIGYDETNDATDTLEGLGAPVFVCEGEHWDGQDSVSDRDYATEDCLQNLDASTSGADLCMAADPNQGDADPTAGASPVALRISIDGTNVYVASNIFSVGRAVVYTDGASTASIYLRDNTPGNVLAAAISAAGITQGHPSEDDCNQSTYVEGATTGDRELCGRDNTAITVNLLV